MTGDSAIDTPRIPRDLSLEPFSCDHPHPFRVAAVGNFSLIECIRDLSVMHSDTACASGQLLRRFRANASYLAQAYRTLSGLAAKGRPLPAESEWLLDNYYVVEEVVREIRTDLPASYYRELPVVTGGPFHNSPRIYPVAVAMLAYTDSVLSEAAIREAVTEYQRTVPLNTGELWAIPTMLRLGLLENLRRLADQILTTVAEYTAAANAIDIAKVGRDPHLPENPPDGFAVGIWEGLRDNDPPPGPAADAIQEWASRHLVDPHAVQHRESCRQASNQVSIGNAITSLRLLGVIDWTMFFEATAMVEVVLRSDPSGIYPRQDFVTRDSCRRAVEQLARGSRRDELAVAREANKAASEFPITVAGRTPAWHLIGDGRHAFEQRLGYRPKLRAALVSAVLRHPNSVYFGLLLTFMLLVGAGVVSLTANSPVWLMALALIASFLVASELAVSLTNFVVCRLVPPRVRPKLDLKKGIPAEFATLVVIPTLIGKPAQATAMSQRIEEHYLANPDPQLWFALLTDLPDAATETTADDAACVQAILDSVARLNKLYSTEGSPRFFVFHRHRLYNAAEGCWMGWERKRGKLAELNRLLRGATDTSYSVQSHPVSSFPKIRYVLTLDADTVLPREAAKQMIATLAHPLNAAQLSANGRCVEAGYGILQPRVSFLYSTGFRSWFARVFAGSAGVDPYSSAVSDTYMDLFGRGTFTGKGLYDLDAFEATAGHAFPDNHILSHDLIESNYALCLLATDIEVFDEFPSRYHTYAKRQHRWVRGDWQLLPWLGGHVPSLTGAVPNNLPALERWKIIDNLRRSIVAAGIVLLLVLSWTVLPGPTWVWTVLALSPYLLPTILYAWETFLQALRGKRIRGLYARARTDLGATISQAVLQVTVLPHEAWSNLDAITRTLYRLFVSRRLMLEWETAAAAESRLGTGVGQFVVAMWPALAISAVSATALAIIAPTSLPIAGPLLVAWLLSPLIAFAVSRQRDIREAPLSQADRTELRAVCRKTWDFFETFVGPDDNWLPPDNYQEYPRGVVAHRTSPTNIGLYFLATLAAHDLGYLTTQNVIDRLKKGFDSLDKLERYHGHFLNWYETSTLTSLPPGYVSTVDSGNLLGCIYGLKHGLLELTRNANPPFADGLSDTLTLVQTEWARATVTPEIHAKILGMIQDLVTAISKNVRLSETIELADVLATAIRAEVPDVNNEVVRWTEKLLVQARRHQAANDEPSPETGSDLNQLVERAEKFAHEMDFRFLYNHERELFTIGFNIVTGRLDSSHYDLLASEAAIASFLAVARGQVPRKHWFQLGRLAIRTGGEIGLMSWGGTMFEYLMPRLLLPVPRGVLLDQAQHAAVARQIEFGKEEGLPWGVSESGFYLFDAAMTYQYQSFGAPGLGLKRGLNQDRVIAPYATLMAVDVQSTAAIANFSRLRADGGEGPYGFYEAIDYTPERVPATETKGVVRSYMAHHQGMGLLAIVNRLTDGVMRRRLSAEPVVRAAQLLLEERVPTETPIVEPTDIGVETVRLATPEYPSRRRITTPDTPAPRTHLLSNGNYSVLMTNAGGGFSRCGDLAVTRWRADSTLDGYGQFLFVRDRRSGAVWSAGHQPTCRRADAYEVTFALDKVDLRRIDDGIETLLEITVVPDQDVEVRRVTLTNTSTRTRHLDVTSYTEIVLNPHAADLAHPAFGKLFLETEWLSDYSALLCRRRPRSPDQQPVWAVQVLSVDGPGGTTSCETSRELFVGRRRALAQPVALDPVASKLSGTTGAVLDPVFAIRRTMRLRTGEKIVLTFTTGVTTTREAAVAVADQYHSPHAVNRAFEFAWAHTRIELQHAHLRPEDVHLFQRLCGHLLYPASPLRAEAGILIKNRRGQNGLWAFGISGDLPILLLRLHSPTGLDHLRQLLQAHTYWRSKGFKADIVVLCENANGYHDDLYGEAISLVRTMGLNEQLDRFSGVFIRKGGQMAEGDNVLLLASARVVIDDRSGPLSSQADAVSPPRSLPPRRLTPAIGKPRFAVLDASSSLSFWNNYGGFSSDGLEYVITPDILQHVPPAPWSNVIANPTAGFMVTDSGGGFAWTGNSQLNRLTPWSNDPVSDPPGDAIYLQDDATGSVWSATPLPIRDGGSITVRHGQGYSVFERVVNGIEQELTVYVPPKDPVKISLLKLKNTGAKPIKLIVAYYVEWVLGPNRDVTAQHIVTERDAETGSVFARNPFNIEYGSHVAFVAGKLDRQTITGDRAEFIGRNSSLAAPAAFDRTGLSGRVGPGLDPCAVIHGSVLIQPGEERTVVFLLGQTVSAEVARTVIQRHLAPAAAEETLKTVVDQWDALCEAVQVKTPDPAFDLMMNRWLIYQTLSCRVWGRSAFSQSGGAYGFRDQLQDVLALLHAAPTEARKHILRAASRQFLEGDVQHWWHEPAGNGVRTRFSDDFLWMPYAACIYAETIGDVGIFDEMVPFLVAPPLAAHEHERYDTPTVAGETATLYDHCVRALEHGWKLGAHGLPLMGTGDWNDGMNTVGAEGRGESVWVAWFQIVCRNLFANVADLRGDRAYAQTSRARAEQLRDAVETNAYDGAWYRRAYFDDGTPLGSAQNEECRIDSLTQSWSAISGVADPARSTLAMNEAMKHLVQPANRLVLLFEPPFDTGPLQPGYIKGYLPGVRENGGQYTHAACWMVKALAAQGRTQEAYRLFDLLNPIRSSNTMPKADCYRGEPYVIAADVYSRPPLTGRAGWTWYTGSAAWFYRVGLEDILGFHRVGDRLHITPCVPTEWRSFQVTYRFGKAVYKIDIQNTHKILSHKLTVDGVTISDGKIPLVDDGKEHTVKLVTGRE